MDRERTKLTYVDLIVFVIVLIAMTSLLVACISLSSARSGECTARLKELGVGLKVYEARWGSYPTQSGAECFRALQKDGILPGNESYLCPLSGTLSGANKNDYLGPSPQFTPLSGALPAGHPIGADKKENHCPSFYHNVLLFDISVQPSPDNQTILSATVWFRHGGYLSP